MWLFTMNDVTVNIIFSFTVVKESETFSCKHANKGSIDLEANRYRFFYKHAFNFVQTRHDKCKSFPIKHPHACIHAPLFMLPLKLRICLCYVIIATIVEFIFVIIIITSSLYQW